MKSYDIHHYRTLYVVPFEFRHMPENFETAVREIGEKLGTGWEVAEPNFNKDRKGERDVYYQITHEFDCVRGVSGKMGCFWKKTDMETETCAFGVKAIDGTVYADITSAGIYAFRTGIGFLCYEASFRIGENGHGANTVRDEEDEKYNTKGIDLNSSELLRIQDYFKELAHEKKITIGENTEPQAMGRHIAKFLSRLDVTYPASRHNRKAEVYNESELIPDKTLMFTYVVFRHEQNWTCNQDVLSTVYYLTHGYKESYLMSAEAEKGIKRPFGNCFWGASREGCGHFTWPTGEGVEDNAGFFYSDNHYRKTINDYFTLYIRALYLSYSLFHMAKELDTLSCDFRDYLSENAEVEEELRKIRNLRAKINVFLAKSVMTSVSHIQHQNEFYAHIIEQLRVNQDIASVQVGLDALNALSASAVEEQKKQLEAENRKQQREEEQREKESDEKFQAGLACITFLALFSALADAWQVVDGIRHGKLEWWGWLIVGISFLFCFVAFAIALKCSWGVLAKTVKDLFKKEQK